MSQVTVTKVVEGASHLVLRVDLVSDGTGELVNRVILTPQDLSPAFPAGTPSFRLMQVWYSLVWFDATFKTGTVTPEILWTLAKDCDSHTDFRSFGGLIDKRALENPVSDDTGYLTISTKNFAPAGSTGSFVLELRKTNQASA